ESDSESDTNPTGESEQPATHSSTDGVQGTPFTIPRSKIPESDGRLEEDTRAAFLNDGPDPPLRDSIRTLSRQDPRPTEREGRIARALYIYGRAQIGALPGYDLSESMVELRDHIEDTLDVSIDSLVTNGYLAEKLVDGRLKYFGLTETGRQFLWQSNHPDVRIFRPDIVVPVLGDGAVHNLGVRQGGDWLSQTRECKQVAQPDLSGSHDLDLGGYKDAKRTWAGEVVAAEDLSQDTSERSSPSDTVLSRIQYLGGSAGQSLLVFESSPVAVRAITQLDHAGEIHVPADITYRNFSIAQLQQRLVPEINHGAFDQIESISTLNNL
ncbi:MAG: hypothetical protein ABEI52_07415, partial [Halobacteriaceae archaeon]